MRDIFAAILVGLLAGLLYGLLRTRSPAPPPIALLGLAAMLLGERLPTFLQRWF